MEDKGSAPRPPPRRVLFIQFRQLGDVLLTTPALRAARRAWPEARIDFLTEELSAPLFRHNPDVTEVVVQPRRLSLAAQLGFALGVRRRRYDLVLDFLGNPRSAWLTLLSGARTTVGFAFRGRGRFYQTRVAPEESDRYAVHFKFDLLRAVGLDPKDGSTDLRLSPSERSFADRALGEVGFPPDRPFLTLSPVSRRSYKVWSLDRFAAAADALARRWGVRALLLWGPGEREIAQGAADRMREPARLAPPCPTPLEAAALLERALLHVGNDNGHRHLAIAVGTPTVGVFGPSNPIHWTPPGDPRHRWVHAWGAERSPDPFAGIGPEEVLRAAEGLGALLEERSRGARVPAR